MYFGPQRLGPHRQRSHLCKFVYLHITRIFHANYNCKKSLKICKSKDRQHNGEIKIDNRTNNKLQNITHKP